MLSVECGLSLDSPAFSLFSMGVVCVCVFVGVYMSGEGSPLCVGFLLSSLFSVACLSEKEVVGARRRAGEKGIV